MGSSNRLGAPAFDHLGGIDSARDRLAADSSPENVLPLSTVADAGPCTPDRP